MEGPALEALVQGRGTWVPAVANDVLPLPPAPSPRPERPMQTLACCPRGRTGSFEIPPCCLQGGTGSAELPEPPPEPVPPEPPPPPSSTSLSPLLAAPALATVTFVSKLVQLYELLLGRSLSDGAEQLSVDRGARQARLAAPWSFPKCELRGGSGVWLRNYAYLENRGCNYSVITV